MQNGRFVITSLLVAFLLSTVPFSVYGQTAIKLPQPSLTGDTSVEKAIAERRSVRNYKNDPLHLREVGQVLWAAQGITDPSRGLRSAPSPRGAYLLKLYLVAGNVTDLAQGMYRYEPKGHELVWVAEGDKKTVLFDAAGQGPIKAAPAALVITGETGRSGNPGWAYLEAGHAAENVYLECVSLKLGTVSMAGFKPDQVKKALDLPDREEVIYIMPLGRK
jgi:SagB-type dehydrogenase family enzyme